MGNNKNIFDRWSESHYLYGKYLSSKNNSYKSILLHGILWEIFEYNIFYHKNNGKLIKLIFKEDVNRDKDSLKNMVSDILFTLLGAYDQKKK